MVSFRKAQRLAQRGQVDAAEAGLRPALRDGADVRNWLVLGRILEQAGRIEDAHAVLDEARNRFPDYAPAQLFYGIAALDLKRVSDATAAFRRTLELQPNNDVARSYSALASLMQGDNETGTSTLRNFGITDNRAFRVRLTEWMETEWLTKGRFFAQQPAQLPTEPRPSRPSSRRAEKYFHKKQYHKLLWELDFVVREEQPDETLVFGCAFAAEMIFDYERALDYLSRYKTQSENVPGQVTTGTKSGWWHRAELWIAGLIRKLLNREESTDWHDAVRATRARSLIRLGDFHAGSTDLAKVTMIGPEDHGANYYLGILCLAFNERHRARQLFHRAHTQYLVDTIEYQYWQMEQALFKT